MIIVAESHTGALAKAIKSRPDLHFGVYFSQFEWYHPLYLQDKNNSFKTQYYVQVLVALPCIAYHLEHSAMVISSSTYHKAYSLK